MHSSSGKLASSDVVLHFFGLISLHLCSVLAPPSGGWHSLNPCINPVVNYLKTKPSNLECRQAGQTQAFYIGMSS